MHLFFIYQHYLCSQSAPCCSLQPHAKCMLLCRSASLKNMPWIVKKARTMLTAHWWEEGGDVKLPPPKSYFVLSSSNPLPECATQVHNLTAYSHRVSVSQPHSKMRHGLLTGKAHVHWQLSFHFVSGCFGWKVLFFMVMYCSLHISTQTILYLPIHLHYTTIHIQFIIDNPVMLSHVPTHTYTYTCMHTNIVTHTD